MMSYINVFINTVIGGLAGWLLAQIGQFKTKAKQEEADRKALSDSLTAGMRVLMHRQLLDYYTAYKDVESIPQDIWGEIDHVYAVYHQLGGNSTGSRIYESLKSKSLDSED